MRKNEAILYTASIAFLSVTMFAFFGINLTTTRHRSIVAAEDVGRSQILLVKSEIDRTLQGVIDLIAITREVFRFGDLPLLHALRRYALFGEEIGNGGVYDREGILESSLQSGAPVIPDRLPEEVRDQIRYEGDTTIFVANGAVWIVSTVHDGRVVTVGIDRRYFDRMNRLTLDPSLRAYLFDPDGTVIAVWHGEDGPATAPRWEIGSIFPREREGRTLHVETVGATVYAEAQLGIHPFTVVVEYPRGVVLSEWRRQIPWQLTYIAVGHLVMVALVRAVRRQRTLWVAAEHQRTIARETNHRMKNHIALLDGILSLSEAGDDRCSTVVRETRGRLRSIGMIHELLYSRDDGDEVSFDDYATRLVEVITETLSPPETAVATRCAIAPITLPVQSVRHLGLIIHELVTNALKYATPNGTNDRSLELEVTFRYDTTTWELIVADNGPGFTADAGNHGSHSVGNLIVASVAEDLSATIRRENRRGACTSVSGPLPILTTAVADRR
ncbi:MAG: sensor histidine kinase [Alkalispirochaeta sp.]